ncbi:hypothetical protein EYF80_033597 [Liparis tanakae]|uniref:Uncharacterized protein n=1 Tax=Liparis tanakae TaxID=230148 RepID=A0A4Z2GSD3_9TELE|nr:hypothetical protein EYF80_033597 [Liparis tanakae]
MSLRDSCVTLESTEEVLTDATEARGHVGDEEDDQTSHDQGLVDPDRTAGVFPDYNSSPAVFSVSVWRIMCCEELTTKLCRAATVGRVMAIQAEDN